MTVAPMDNTTSTVVPDLHAYLGEFDPFALKPLAGGWEAGGVKWIVGVGDDVKSSEAAVDAAWSLRDTVAGVGLHPNRLPFREDQRASLADALDILAELATDPQVGVISDIGIDEAVEAPRSVQEDVLKTMLDTAVSNVRSVLLHWNAPVAELLDFWDARAKVPRAALLSFSGDVAQAQELLDRGFFFTISPEAVGLSGPQTISSEVLRSLPDDRLFVHSDTRGGEANGRGPDIVLTVLDRLASQRGVDPGALASHINTNLWQFLSWRSK